MLSTLPRKQFQKDLLFPTVWITKNRRKMKKEPCGTHYKYTYLLSSCYLSSGSALSHENDSDIHPGEYGKG